MNDLLKCVYISETPLVLYDCIPRMNVVANVIRPLSSAFDCLIAQVPLNGIVVQIQNFPISADCLRTFIQLYRGGKTKLYFFVLKYTGLILLLCNMRQDLRKTCMHNPVQI
jgi:hypothetical protein